MNDERSCLTCKWHDGFSWACCNGDSEYRGEFTGPEMSCDQWERGDPVCGPQ